MGKMDYNEKENLIRSLATSMGMPDVKTTKYSGSRYDPATGTLYCEHFALPHSSLERIKDWYRHQMEQYRNLSARDSEMMEQYMRYAVAYNAICLLKDDIENK
ncbi:MAG: hypothetical protein K5985_01170 [Lachnospiraceae bacterium]|nr:hypothetical protein [Lachnospiraceae bacterium]